MVVREGGAVSYEGGTPESIAGQVVRGCILGNVQWVRGGLVFQAHTLLYHSNVGLRVGKKKSALIERWEVTRVRCAGGALGR